MDYCNPHQKPSVSFSILMLNERSEKFLHQTVFFHELFWRSYSDIFIRILIFRVGVVFPMVNSLYREMWSETVHEFRSNSSRENKVSNEGLWMSTNVLSRPSLKAILQYLSEQESVPYIASVPVNSHFLGELMCTPFCRVFFWFKPCLLTLSFMWIFMLE